MSTTPTLRDAAQQALDALGVAESLLAQDKSYHHPKVLKAYNDLRAALAARAAGYSEEWCRAAAEAEEAGNACWDAGAALTQGAGAVEPVATEVLAESEDGEHIIIACGEVDYRCSCGQWRASFATITPAMIDWQEHVKTGHTLPPDYLAGHKDALEWAAQVVEADHPLTGDWLYDDRNDLANALRKGPEMPPAAPAPPAQQLQQAVARALEPIQQAIRDYHYALDTRQHGGHAGSHAFDAICEHLGMHWEQGKEAAIRAKGTQ